MYIFKINNDTYAVFQNILIHKNKSDITLVFYLLFDLWMVLQLP